MVKYILIAIFSAFFGLPILASECANPCWCIPTRINQNQIYIGPEIYHVKREREGGSVQKGMSYGVRAGYDRIKRCRLYWGGDLLYARGSLNGESGRGIHLKSSLIDESIEGRLGYTWQKKCGIQASITPFIGVGYFREINKYRSPASIRFTTSFPYGSIGFLSSLPIYSRTEVGLRFKAKLGFDPICKVSENHEHPRIKQNVGQEFQYRLDLPITYQCCSSERFALSLVPFYEYRHYGKATNFPFDFLETKYQIYGATFELVYLL